MRHADREFSDEPVVTLLAIVLLMIDTFEASSSMIAPPRSAATLSTIMLLRMLIGCIEGVEHEDAAAVVQGAHVALDQVAVDVHRSGAVAQRSAADRQLALDGDAAARVDRIRCSRSGCRGCCRWG